MTDALRSALDRIGVSSPLQATAVGGRWRAGAGPILRLRSPIDGRELGSLPLATPREAEETIAASADAFAAWRAVPAPLRGEFVRAVGQRLREHKSDLAVVVTHEVGKITSEALGEVQEMIDICDFAVGLSRQLHGLTIASERPGHRLAEQWHPLGPVGVISAFNFPMAVWAWNAAIGWVCGDPVVWKPSEKAPLSAIACQTLIASVLADTPHAPGAVSSLLIGAADVGQAMASSQRLPLISATGSVPMGRAVAQTVANRLGRSLLELGGNNGMIVTPAADLDLALRAILFSAVGTCGQRCTTLRRLIAHRSIADQLLSRLRNAYDQLSIGDPTRQGTLVGPLIDDAAATAMEDALAVARRAGGRVHGGGRIESRVPAGGAYVRPAIVELDAPIDIVRHETFAPILYVLRYESLHEAIRIHNDVPQGLASAIFTTDVREAELFCSAAGSDCGIVNVNIGTSGAEIGGAFGGEKETGGGRESGSDAWKNYMRRATNTINYSAELPLAQGIQFDVQPEASRGKAD